MCRSDTRRRRKGDGKLLGNHNFGYYRNGKIRYGNSAKVARASAKAGASRRLYRLRCECAI